MSKIERKSMRHYLDSTFGGTTPSWYLLGRDLDEFNVELNPEIEIETDILGNEYVLHNGYAPSADAEPFYTEVGDALFNKLQAIVDEYDRDCQTSMLEVHMWNGNATNGYAATRQNCYVVPVSYGGDTTGYQIPFNIVLYGEKIPGTFIHGVFTSNVAPVG